MKELHQSVVQRIVKLTQISARPDLTIVSAVYSIDVKHIFYVFYFGHVFLRF